MPTSLDQPDSSACRRERGTVLQAISETPGTCRSIVRAALHAHGLAALADDAETVVTEFASNAVRAARAGTSTEEMPVIVLVLEWRPRGIRIEVWDRAPDLPQLRKPDFEAEHGRGLYLVNEITAGRWGCRPAEGSKCVWADLGEDHQ